MDPIYALLPPGAESALQDDPVCTEFLAEVDKLDAKGPPFNTAYVKLHLAYAYTKGLRDGVMQAREIVKPSAPPEGPK